ncbi:MAG: NAD(P)-binding protein [Leptospiraceae bacterium]|nr:NAD(P)-binding protein [Leptospiraceae bacterium]
MTKLAIIGTGIAGLGLGHFIHKDFDINYFDKIDYIGGHTNTVDVAEGRDILPIDTGFIVFNEVTYPNLTRLFQELSVDTKNSSMSFSVQHLPSRLEFCGSGVNGLFAQRSNVFNVPYLKLLYQINRFNIESPAILDDPKYLNYTLKQYILEKKMGTDILYRYIIPMSSAVWSTEERDMLEFPVVSLVRFFCNHGFLGLNTQHQWKTVVNGSRSYIKKIIEPFKDKFQLKNGAKKVIREDGRVKLILQDGSFDYYDKLVFACHADTALSLLENPTLEEKNLLQNFRYQKNIATLHTDDSIMPRKKLAWSSWNYRVEDNNDSSVIYWMNSLQGISKKINYFVSINDPNKINPQKIIRKINYEHPIFSVNAMKAQDKLFSLNQGKEIYYCGSYFKYGFHEDAFTSGLNLARTLLGRDLWS